MKKINKLMNSDWLHRLAVLVVGLICVVGNVQANHQYFYAHAKVSADTGGGKVYAHVTNSNSDTSTKEYTSSEFKSDIYETTGGVAYCHFWASPDAGYEFVKWTDESGKKFTKGSIYDEDNGEHIVKYVENNNNGESNAVTTTYIAHFRLITGWVKVAAEEGGTASISNSDNVKDDIITITAMPDDSYFFNGWYKHVNGTETLITTENPYTFTVTENITYYAHFAKATIDYCTLKNVSTGKYLSLYGDYTATSTANGYVFTNSLKTISNTEANNNPMIVFKRVATSGSEIKGYLSTDLSNRSGVITTNTLIGRDAPLTFSLQDNKYRISTTIDNVTYYLCDDRSEFVSLQSSNTNGIDWELTLLTEELVSGAFGANANTKYTKGDKYYTSMYAPFAYKLLDDVNAYYLNLDDDFYDEATNTITLTQIAAGEIVPENMAVIIECNSANDPTQNRLLPVDEYTITNDQKAEYAKNLLRGYNQIVCQEENEQYKAVTNDKVYMYVFSIKNNELGFYHYGGATIPKNKAYLKLNVTLEEISEVLNSNPNTVKLAFGSRFGDENLNSINLFNDVVDDDNQPIYNLQGVQVKNPEKGIYIRGNKKYLVK